jgi:hypothetical protein
VLSLQRFQPSFDSSELLPFPFFFLDAEPLLLIVIPNPDLYLDRLMVVQQAILDELEWSVLYDWCLDCFGAGVRMMKIDDGHSWLKRCQPVPVPPAAA